MLAYQFTDTDGGIILPNVSQISWNLCTYDQFKDIVLTINGTDNPN
nr:MAG TPA: Dynein attachment factor N-terminus [Bacteriophage sp.]